MNWIACCLLTLLPLLLCGQSAEVGGRILGGDSREGLPYASVVLIRNGSQQGGTLTEEDGRFQLGTLEAGSYVLEISYLGFLPLSHPFRVGDAATALDLGNLLLETDAAQLDEVTVTGRRETVAAALDRKVFSLDDNLSQAGGSALEAMRNLPGVTVDPEGRIILRGSDRVSVLIDGKPSSLTGFGNQKGLDNLPAANIERIEIINNPSAKYDARGLAGIINIIYKQDRQDGWNGEAALYGGLGELTQRRANLPNLTDKYRFTPKLNPSISLNYRQKKVNLFFQGDGIVRRRVNNNTFTLRDYTDGREDIQSQFLENRQQQLYNLKGGLDWFIDPRNTLTLFALWQDEYHNDYGYVPYDDATTGERRRLWTWVEDERTSFINYSAAFSHKFAQPGHSLDLSYLYTGGGEDELFPFVDYRDGGAFTDGTFLTIYEYVNNLSLDYTRPLASGTLELGGKTSLRSIPLTYTLYPGERSILDPNLGNYSEYKEDVYAFYGNYVYDRERYTLEAGLRFEPTVVNFTIDPDNAYYGNVAYDYQPLFPSARLTFKGGGDAGGRVSLFYNRRIDRPGEFFVRPFPKYDDPELLKTGNPELRPQFTQTVEAAWKRGGDKGSLYGALFYRSITDIFARILTTDGNAGGAFPIFHTIPQNLGNGTNLGAEVTVERRLSPDLRFDASLSGYRNHIDAFLGTHRYPTVQPFSVEASTGYTWNGKFNLNGDFSETLDGQLTAQYLAPNIIPQGKTLSRFSLDFGLRKRFPDRRLEASLAVTDLLNTFQVRETFTDDDFRVVTENYYETQVITAGLKYKLK